MPAKPAVSPQNTSAYDFAAIERKWQARWEASRCFEVSADLTGPRFYNFDGGPFPNGPLHMGHVRTFTLGDVMARYQRMLGKNVLYCLEFDAFGLPNELIAQERGISPEALTRSNIALIRTQMRCLGLSYDWRHVHVTCDPRYYRWTQWLFLKLYEQAFIYRAPAELNWCPQCGTTLAHMQVIEGCCWRCESRVEQRILTQWFVRLRQYSDILYETLSKLEGWSSHIRHLLRGFIGASYGVEIDFEVVGQPGTTLTGFTQDEAGPAEVAYLAIAPGHPALKNLLTGHARREAVRQFHEEIQRVPLRERHRRDAKERQEQDLSGIDTGIRARHPLTGMELPVFVARYVDPHFATGIEIGNPAASGRDAAFTRFHGIQAPERTLSSGDGDSSSRWPQSLLRRVVQFRVHDWLVSRQRSWGTPIPIVHCDACGVVPVLEDHLPVTLPEDLFEGHREYGLNNHPEFVNVPCPRCQRLARRETDTLDCYFDVVWCFLACATRLDDGFAFRSEDFRAWMPVDWFHNGLDSFFYVHLYRFIGRVLFEMGILADPEPIRRYYGHDAVLSSGKKMSKHHRNVVSPDEIMQHLGADVLRLHIAWAANPLKSVEWSDANLERAQRFLAAVWDLIVPRAEMIHRAFASANPLPREPRIGVLERALKRILRRVTAFLEDYRYNACLEELHSFLNHLVDFTKQVDRMDVSDEALYSFARAARTFILLLTPFAPHLCEELWERTGGEGLATTTSWPQAAFGSQLPPHRG